MFPRAVWLLCLTCLGCQAVLGTPTSVDPGDGLAPVRHPSSAAAAPRPGNVATIKPSPLSRAAASPADGDEEQACAHLSQVVAAQPGQRTARILYAELLFEHGRHDEAREQYQQLIAACQEHGERERRQLLHCHGKLLALAQTVDDEYEVQLQRGIGMWLLAQERASLGDPTGDVPVEGLLCKAAACLMKAHALRRDQARPCCYLHKIWRQLGQPQQARRWLNQAVSAAPFTPLTPQEQRELLLEDVQLK